MRTKYLKLVLISIMIWSCAAGIALASVDDPVEFLPRDNEVSIWHKEGPEAFYYTYSLSNVLDELAASIVKEYGFRSMLSQLYTMDLNEIEIRIFEMDTPEDAFGLFSIFADIPREVGKGETNVKDLDIIATQSTTPEQRWVGDSELHLLGDNYFIQLVASDDQRKVDLMSFALRIMSKFDTPGGELIDTDSLDRDELIAGSVRLIGGTNTLNLFLETGGLDPFGLADTDIRLIMGDYRSGGKSLYRQLVADCGGEDAANKAWVEFGDWVDRYYFYKPLKVVSAIGAVYAVDENKRYIAAFRDGEFIRVFFGFDNKDKLTGFISYYGEKN